MKNNVGDADRFSGSYFLVMGALLLINFLGATIVIGLMNQQDPAMRSMAQMGLVVVISALSCLVLLRLNQNRLATAKVMDSLVAKDKLTGLTNRAVFQHHLLSRVCQSNGQPGNDTKQSSPAKRSLFKRKSKKANAKNKLAVPSFALMQLNIDRFKELNAILGYQQADELLQCFAERLAHVVSNSEDAARLNGDEFALIIVYDGTNEDLEVQMRSVFDHLYKPYLNHSQELELTFSAGVALYPDDSTDHQELAQKAQLALQRAKEDGHDRVYCYDDLADTKVKDFHYLSQDMNRAIRAGEFQLYFQPQFSFKTGKQTGFEALMRWIHPERGTISPTEFIPIAEKNGLIVPLSEFALREACRRAVTWVNPLKVAVNLSPVQMRQISIADLVANVLAETGLEPERLELEVTESLFIDITDKLATDLLQLQKMGISIALDDFGTGYSSLNYLTNFPFNKIKIDRSFVQNLAGDESSMAIIASIIGMGKSLDMRITAEGIEDKRAHEILRLAGCDEAQGYLLGKPRDIDAYPGLEMQEQQEEATRPVTTAAAAAKILRLSA